MLIKDVYKYLSGPDYYDKGGAGESIGFGRGYM